MEKFLVTDGAQIFSYKIMISHVFRLLAGRTADASTRALLVGLSEQEAQDAADWAGSHKRLAGAVPARRDALLRARTRLMMAILGPRSLLEWLLIAEDECLERLSIRTALLEDKQLAGQLTRIAADERLHVVNLKQEVLGMEGWEMGESGGIRDVIFGANDGLVSILALVAGVYGALTDSDLILITGLAGAIAGTISMGAGAYLSAKSEAEVTQKERARKGDLSGTREQNQVALGELYRQQGMSEREAQAVAERVAGEMEFRSGLTVGQVTGLTSQQDWPPSKAGLLTGLSFLLASVVPILPFAILEVRAAAVTAMLASVCTLFAVGASKAVFTRSSWLRSGLENLLIGVLAAGATYLIGVLIPGV